MRALIVFFCVVSATVAGAFQLVSPAVSAAAARRPFRLLESKNEDVDTASMVNGGGNDLLLAKDAKSQLFSAFAALQLPDQYDAVLTGLCAKILDARNLSEAEASLALNDPIQLVEEMNSKNIPASPRSLMALIDATVKTQNAKKMATILSLAARNPGGITQYGADQADILQLPSSPTSRLKCPDGSYKTRTERLESVAPVPTDEREKESVYALAFGGLVASSVLFNVLGMDDMSPYANALLSLVVLVAVLDNFYDVVMGGAEFVANQVLPRVADSRMGALSKSNSFQLPDMDSLPLGLGKGQLSGSTVRGLTRLLTVDAERESQCEAAALFAAYALGLPCFAFRPNAFEGSVLVVESLSSDNDVAPLLSSSGILRMLVWLMAPVAAEAARHAQLIVSDPREAAGFLQRLEEFCASDEGSSRVNAQELWWQDDEQERRDLLQWAYTEADLLLRNNRAKVTEISNRLTGGAATIGDCVAVMENW